MRPLEEIEPFAGLAPEVLVRLRALAEQRLVRAGATLVRRGVRGRELLVVASGGVTVDPGGGEPTRSLGPGSVLGEISILTDGPTSATVRAQRDSHLWAIAREDLLDLLEACPELRAALMELVLSRRDPRRVPADRLRPQLVLVGRPEDEVLARAWLPRLAHEVARTVPTGELAELASSDEARERIDAWRAESSPGGILLLALPPGELDRLDDRVQPGDGVLRFDEAGVHDGTVQVARWGLADHARLRSAAAGRPGAAERWAFRVAPEELTGPGPTPELDRLVRWVTRRQVGLALGAGAARGFAHLGVLAELEDQGIAIDRLAGTSMGGIAALLYGLAGDGPGGISRGAETLGRPGARRMSWWPRAALLSDRELRRRAREVAGGRNFADLALPVSVVAADLVRGERVVLERGPVDEAFFATSAVPGALPPVDRGHEVLVDGALVSRIPLDLLPPSRCALRIAVHVVPAPEEEVDVLGRAADLRRRLARFLGLREALGRSWELLGWQQGAREAEGADVLLEPRTAALAGYDFAGTWREMVEAGRAAVREQAEELRTLAASRLGPAGEGAGSGGEA